MQLHDRHVVITGASRGIGAAIARECAARGARVTLVARSAGPLADLATDLGGHAIAADLSDPSVMAGLVARIDQEAGPVDVLVNNAGVDVAGGFAELDRRRSRARDPAQRARGHRTHPPGAARA